MPWKMPMFFSPVAPWADCPLPPHSSPRASELMLTIGRVKTLDYSQMHYGPGSHHQSSSSSGKYFSKRASYGWKSCIWMLGRKPSPQIYIGINLNCQRTQAERSKDTRANVVCTKPQMPWLLRLFVFVYREMFFLTDPLVEEIPQNSS